MNAASLVQKVWNFCHTLRDDGVGYGDCLEQLTYERQDFWETTSNKQLNFLQHIVNMLKEFRFYPYEELTSRDKASLDVFWLKDDSLDNLEAALASFRDVAAGLPSQGAALTE